MGLLHCYEMSEALIGHLVEKGPISVNDAADKYHSCHEMGYNTWEEGRRIEAHWACRCSAIFYMENNIVEPADRRAVFAVKNLMENSTMTAEQLQWFLEFAPGSEINRLIKTETDSPLFDDLSYELEFDPIVWKISEQAQNDPSLLKPYWGVDT